MEFTYNGYLGLLKDLHEHGYRITGYDDWKEGERCAILRHDIDCDIQKAVKMAELECAGGGGVLRSLLCVADL